MLYFKPFHMSFKDNPTVKKIIHWSIRIGVGFLGTSIFLVILFRFVPISGTFLMLERYFESRPENAKPYHFQKEWIPIDDVSEHLVLAVVCSEDQHFEELYNKVLNWLHSCLTFCQSKYPTRLLPIAEKPILSILNNYCLLFSCPKWGLFCWCSGKSITYHFRFRRVGSHFYGTVEVCT